MQYPARSFPQLLDNGWMNEPNRCPCDTALPYADCCGRLHAGEPAADALALMRSRYSAYVLEREDYLRASWDPATCPVDLSPDGHIKWLRLTIIEHRPIDDTHAEVHFEAKFIAAGRHGRMLERSRFQKVDGRWRYVDGDIGG